MKILLTGAGGFLGKQIARSLLANGAGNLRLHFRQRPPAGFVEGFGAQFPDACIEWVAANLLARGKLDSVVHGVDCIVHAAAGMRGAAADMFANTVLGSRNVLEAAIAGGVQRVVLVSSFSVYNTEKLASGALLTESNPIEQIGINKGPYGYAKTRQEQLFLDLAQQHGLETVILRPGVIYGPGGGGLSPRVGIKAMGVFFSLGGKVTLPLTYVDNCADAVAQATLHAPSGSTFNVVDDDLPSCAQFLAGYRRQVQAVRTLQVPYWAFLIGARWLQRYHHASKGQLPAVFTPYVVRSMYRPLSYSNAALRAIGWNQGVSTSEAMERAFHWLRDQRR
ncbi:MAG: NAD(P)-dependent oxidoreductase [Burkholderiaceae bacterium]